MKNDKKETTGTGAKDVIERGKKAIDAGKKFSGENPADPETKKKEKQDAEAWRNEG